MADGGSMHRNPALAAALVLAAVMGPGGDHGPTNQAAPPALTIECTALPASGPAPLSVAFGLDVKNAVGTFRVSLSYGDGTEGPGPDARGRTQRPRAGRAARLFRGGELRPLDRGDGGSRDRALLAADRRRGRAC